MNNSLLMVVNSNYISWVRPCLQSIKQNLTNFSKLYLVCSEEDYKDISESTRSFDIQFIINKEICNINKDYLKDAHHIFMSSEHIDSENVSIFFPFTIFTRPYDMLGAFNENKPVILMDRYSSLSKMTGDIFEAVLYWQKSTEDVLNINNIKYEFMRNLPITIPTRIIRETSKYLLDLYQLPSITDFLNYIKNDDIPEGFCFSHFNVILAYMYEKHNSDAFWIDMSKELSYKKHIIPSINICKSLINEERVIKELEDTLESDTISVRDRRNILKLLDGMKQFS